MEEKDEMIVEENGDCPEVVVYKKQKKGSSFWMGVVCGLLVATIIVGAAIIVRHLYSKSIIDRTVSEVEKADTTSVTENRELVDATFIKKVGIIESIIDKYYLNDYSTDEIEDGVYQGMIDSLGDKYSTYYSAEEMKAIREDTGGYYCGIGVYFSYDEEMSVCVIAGTIEGTPAEEAGLREGDIIYKVDGKDVQGLLSSDVVPLIRGEEGTIVHLTLIREGVDELIEKDIVRKRVETTSVGYEMLEDNIGYIAISEFDAHTAEQFTEALAILKDEGARGLIFDLRSNLGGNLDAVCEMCRQILPKGIIVYTMDKYGQKEEYQCDGSNELELPLVVLVNSHSASASEIMTGAVKDYGIGTIVGTTTYGKGVVQKLIPLTDGSTVRITASQYYTPSGVCIHGIGIDPDIEVEFDGEAYYNDGFDNQLDAAIQEIHKKWESE